MEFLNKVFLGECEDIMPMLPDACIDMVLCDLPYGQTKADWDTPIDLTKLWPEYARLCKPNAAICLFAQSPFNITLGASNLEDYRYEWIWEKSQATGHLNANRCPMKAHENILVFYKKLPVYNPQKTSGHILKTSLARHKKNTIKNQSEIWGDHSNFRDYSSTERYPRSVIKFPSDKQKSALHTTQKPVKLLEYLIKTYTHPGMVVLDNCAGSGSTGEACINTGRNFILIEKFPEFKTIIDTRLSKLKLL